LKIAGLIMWAMGFVLFGYATFGFDPSVDLRRAPLPYEVRESPYLPDRIVNTDRQQRQLLLAMAGLTLFLSGAVIHALGHLQVRGRAGPGKNVRPTPEPTSPDRAGTSSLADPEIMARRGIRPGDDGAQV
jgi:hypothetical protein